MKIYGRNSILERLHKNPQSLKNVFLEKDGCSSDLEDICRTNKVPVRYLLPDEFKRQAKDIRAQGVIADIGEFAYVDFEDILGQPKESLPAILFLDNLNDPQNLGSIIRTAACLGGFAICLPKHDSVEVTEAVLRVASWGENYSPISKVTNLSRSVEDAKAAGYWIYGAVVEGGKELYGVNFNGPAGIVIGSEGKGIRQGLMKHLDFKITIPMQEASFLSFNAGIACGLFCYEVSRQRRK